MFATAGDAAAAQAWRPFAPRPQRHVDSRSAPERIRGGDLHHEYTKGYMRAGTARTAPR